ncbi:hypothetical protein P4O66_002650 [Electrophorus voltai]|uniref:Peptidase M14 domain-containing protein n=1 Tax=Electrophorus voltai TaxID=2609070 RepID=A0AAD8YZ58_9TELE|nr:hypothetical protein P4O66_002650 [Electrophorus voltai]
MVSPVGVRVRNHRCLLTGRDLNQIDRSKLQDSFPSVWATRRLVQRLCEERKVLLYCGLHGHDVFTYGCESPQQELRFLLGSLPTHAPQELL